MTLIRVFPRRTNYTPTDALAFVGEPPLFRPAADEVHVSCCFTWDKPYSEHLAEAWREYYPDVQLGGPAYGDRGEFVPGRYVRDGVTFTSRGCNNRCDFCLVPEREGQLREIESFPPGYIIQDNNLLQCSWAHIQLVWDMLRRRSRAADFVGGLDARLVTSWFAETLQSIRVARVFLACDTDAALDPLREAARLLSFLGRNKLYCYVLIGRESMAQAEARLRAVWNAGCLPFAQLYQPPDRWIEYPREWRMFARTWNRPAATKTLMKEPKP